MSVSQQTPHFGAGAFNRPDWRWTERAACRDEDTALFFGRDHETRPEREAREELAKEICGWCPVRAECLTEALREPGQYGVWGGLGPDERTAQRRSILRRKGRAA